MGVCFWFDSQAEEAADFYVDAFPNSRILDVTRYGDGGHQPSGSVMTVRFMVDGPELTALNGQLDIEALQAAYAGDKAQSRAHEPPLSRTALN